jgi:hypothetical protein
VTDEQASLSQTRLVALRTVKSHYHIRAIYVELANSLIPASFGVQKCFIKTNFCPLASSASVTGPIMLVALKFIGDINTYNDFATTKL